MVLKIGEFTMKTFINKTFLAVVATILVAGTAFFTSCEKDSQNDNKFHIKTQSKESCYIIAKSDIEEHPIEEEIPLTFDKDVFLSKYELLLSQVTGKEWVSENVKVYMYKFNDSLICPLMHISAYNVTDESGSNLYILIDEEKNKSGRIYYLSKEATTATRTIKCIAKGACHYMKGCYPYEITPGKYVCFPCLSKNGTCIKEESVVFETKVLFEVLSALF